MNKSFSIKKLAFLGVFTCLVFLATYLLKIPHAVGYTNLGDTIIFACAMLFNPLFSFIAGGLGSSIADLVSGYAIYAGPTFLIKGLEGLLASCIARTLAKTKFNKHFSIIFSVIVGGIIMVAGYFLTNTLLYDLSAGTAGLLNDLIQMGINSVLGYIITVFLSKSKALKDFTEINAILNENLNIHTHIHTN